MNARSGMINGEALACMKLIPDGVVDAIISDPPYATTNLKWDSPVDWGAWWAEAARICKADANIVLFCAGMFMLRLLYSQRHWFRYELIWEKTRPTGFLNANVRPLTSHENVLVFRKEGRGTYNPQKMPLDKPVRHNHGSKPCAHYGHPRQAVASTYTDRHPRSVLHFQSEGNTVHPTQKPLALMEFLVTSYTDVGDLVFDPFAGSGTTGAAAVAHNRMFMGCELDGEYFNIAADRIADAAPIVTNVVNNGLAFAVAG